MCEDGSAVAPRIDERIDRIDGLTDRNGDLTNRIDGWVTAVWRNTSDSHFAPASQDGRQHPTSYL